MPNPEIAAARFVEMAAPLSGVRPMSAQRSSQKRRLGALLGDLSEGEREGRGVQGNRFPRDEGGRASGSMTDDVYVLAKEAFAIANAMVKEAREPEEKTK